MMPSELMRVFNTCLETPTSCIFAINKADHMDIVTRIRINTHNINTAMLLNW